MQKLQNLKAAWVGVKMSRMQHLKANIGGGRLITSYRCFVRCPPLKFIWGPPSI